MLSNFEMHACRLHVLDIFVTLSIMNKVYQNFIKISYCEKLIYFFFFFFQFKTNFLTV